MTPYVEKVRTAHDLHVVPRDEKDRHLYVGADCPCEPRCVYQEGGIRIFVHQTHLIDILLCRPSPPPEGSPPDYLLPGPPEGFI